jgi:hypothetical protein
MVDVTAWSILLAGASALVLCAIVAASWLRAAGTPGGWPAAGILGGIAAGLMLGSTLLGRLGPTLYEQIYPGGAEQGSQLDLMKSKHVGEIALLHKIGATQASIVEQQQVHQRELQPLQDAYESAIATQSTRWTIISVALACAWFLFGSVGSAKRSRCDEKPSFAPIASGVASALLAGIPTLLLARWLLHADFASSVTLACVFGAGGILTETRTRLLRPAGRLPSVDFAGAVALAFALLALISVNQHPGVIALVTASAIAITIRLKVRLNRHARRVVRGIAMGAILPAMSALAIARVDVIALASNQTVLIALIITAFLASDGRWLGGWLGWRTLGDQTHCRQAWSRSAAALAAGTGGSQLAIALVAFPPSTAATNMLSIAVFAALLLELVHPLRQRISLAMDAAEQ